MITGPHNTMDLDQAWSYPGAYRSGHYIWIGHVFAKLDLSSRCHLVEYQENDLAINIGRGPEIRTA